MTDTPPRRSLWRRLRWPLVFMGLLAIAYLVRGWWLPPVGAFLDVSEPPRQVDAVLVLGGGPDTRPFVAAALVKNGKAKRVLIPRVKLPAGAPAELVVPEQEILKKVLLLRGVPAEQIVQLPDECSSTLDEAHALARFLDREPTLRVAVVTNDFHTRRVRLLFGRVLGERMQQVSIVAAPTDGCGAANWWQSEDGVVTYTT